MNKKMLLAPILAIALVIFIVASVSTLPSGPRASDNQASPQPSPTQAFNVLPSTPITAENSALPIYNIATPLPTAGLTYASTATPVSGLASSTTVSNCLPILSITGALIIGVVAVVTLFSEKNLKRELSKED